MNATTSPTLGIIGAGRFGTNVARRAIDAGYRVVLSNSRGPESLADLVTELGPQASAGTVSDAARAADLVLVAIPLNAIVSLPAGDLADTVVVDANNYYPDRDGQITDLDEGRVTSSELLQSVVPQSLVVKAFNHIGFEDIVDQALPSGTPDRRALSVAGDDAQARARVIDLLDVLGFDAVDLGPLSESWRAQPGAPCYGVGKLTREQLLDATSRAVRPDPASTLG